MKPLIIVILVGVVASLAHALFAMMTGPSDSKRMVRSLSVRVALSVSLFILLMIGWYLGLIDPH